MDAAVSTHGAMTGHGGSNDRRPYHFYAEHYFFDTVGIRVTFEHEGDDRLRYSVVIREIQPGGWTGRTLATGPTGLVDVGDNLIDARDRLTAACELIVAFLEASTGLIKRADPARPPGLSDMIAEFRRFLTS